MLGIRHMEEIMEIDYGVASAKAVRKKRNVQAAVTNQMTPKMEGGGIVVKVFKVMDRNGEEKLLGRSGGHHAGDGSLKGEGTGRIQQRAEGGQSRRQSRRTGARKTKGNFNGGTGQRDARARGLQQNGQGRRWNDHGTRSSGHVGA